MNEEQVRKIVREEMDRNYRSGNPVVAPHAHNDNDGFQINPVDLLGWQGLPSSTQKYQNPNGSYQYGFTSNNILAQADLSGAGHAAQYVDDKSIGIYKIPIVVGNGAGVQGSFNGGYAPNGTMMAFMTGSNTTSFLYIRFDGQWFGIRLSATPIN